MTFDDWFEEKYAGLPTHYHGLDSLYTKGMRSGYNAGYEQGRKDGVKNHDGRVLLIEFILDNDAGISDTTKIILEGLLK